MIVRKLARGLPLLMILAPGAAWCLGLGDITVDTALNQPLRADIQVLSAAPDDIENMRVSLASQQVFDRVGIERVFALTELNFKVAPANDGGAIIEVTTKQPVREPFLNFLIEMQWPNGRLLREYTVLLDPPVLMDDRGVISNAPVVPAQTAMSSESVADNGSAASSPSSARADAVSSQRAPASYTPASHTVVSGDTLGEIAQRYRADENIELSRMMVAIYRANPEPFAQGNINDLKTGMILRMPDPQEIEAVGSEAAVAEVARQNAVWSESPDRMATQLAVNESSAQAGGRTGEKPSTADTTATAAGDSPARDGDKPARLKIMAADEGGATADAADAADAEAANDTVAPRTRNATENQNLLARELAESRRVEIDSLQTKVAELESMIAKQERIISLQSEALAALQERLATDAAGAETQPSAGDGVPESESVAESVAAAGTQANARAAADAQAPAVAGTASPGQSPRGEADTSPPASKILNDTLTRPAVLASAGAAALLLLALIWLVVKRAASKRTETVDLATYVDNAVDNEGGADAAMPRSRAAAAPKNDAIVNPRNPVAEPLIVAASAKQAHADAGAQAMRHPPKPVNDDTLAEADVYIAYGLHQQGEDLLKEAIKRNPERMDYRLKLLEVYYTGKNHAAFDGEAKSLYDALGGKRDATWERVVAMGLELNPRNPLFAATAAPHRETGEQAPKAGLQTGGAMAAAKLSPERANTPQAAVADNAEMASLPGDLADNGNDPPSADASPTAYNSKMLEFDMSEPGEEVKADASARPSNSSAGHDEEGLNLDLSGLDTADGSSALFDPDQTPDDFSAETDANKGSGLPGNSASLIGLDAGDFDDTSFSIELSAGEPGADDGRAEISSDGVSEQDLNPDNMEDLSDINEVGTKLDLAKAYLDMGDSDGALSTLEEVLQEGDDDQRKEAETLMRQIA